MFWGGASYEYPQHMFLQWYTGKKNSMGIPPLIWSHVPASVAQLDARPTGDQEVVGSTPTPGRRCFVEIDHEIFLRSFSPFHWFKKGSCQFLAKECEQYWFLQD